MGIAEMEEMCDNPEMKSIFAPIRLMKADNAVKHKLMKERLYKYVVSLTEGGETLEQLQEKSDALAAYAHKFIPAKPLCRVVKRLHVNRKTRKGRYMEWKMSQSRRTKRGRQT